MGIFMVPERGVPKEASDISLARSASRRGSNRAITCLEAPLLVWQTLAYVYITYDALDKRDRQTMSTRSQPGSLIYIQRNYRRLGSFATKLIYDKIFELAVNGPRWKILDQGRRSARPRACWFFRHRGGSLGLAAQCMMRCERPSRRMWCNPCT
jgi:hypothetical protein